MSHEEFVSDYLEHFGQVLNGVGLIEALSASRDILETVRDQGGKVMLAGNGASASLASHYALDFTKQAGIPSVCFNDAPLVTAYGNDYGYENWVAQAVSHHGHAGDAGILISSSGRSPNMLKAAERCHDLGIMIVTLTGFEATNPLRQLGDVNFWAASCAYNVVEAVHAVWLGLLCDLIIGKREYGVGE